MSANSEGVKKWAKTHPEKHREQVKKWASEHPEQYQETRRKAYTKRMDKLRQDAIDALGGACVNCQRKDIRCLQIDHVIPLKGGQRIRVEIFYRSIVQGLTENLQVLCANCHAIETYYENGGRGG